MEQQSFMVHSLTTASGASIGSTNAVLKKEEVAVFKGCVYDQQWTNALQFLKGLECWDRAKAAAVLSQGAKRFGIWDLSDACLEGLVNQVMGVASKPSPGLQSWLTLNSLDKEFDASSRAGSDHGLGIPLVLDDIRISPRSDTLTDIDIQNNAPISAGSVHGKDKDIKGDFPKARSKAYDVGRSISDKKVNQRLDQQSPRRLQRSLINVDQERWLVNEHDDKGAKKRVDVLTKLKWGLGFIILVISHASAISGVTKMYPDVFEHFGWPVYFARTGGMATACWTAVMYATMSRSAMSWLSLRVPKTKAWLTIFDAHKDLHIFSGIWLCVTATEHIIAHCIGTIPGMLTSSLEEMNNLFGCANTNSTPGLIPLDLSMLSWHHCPLKKLPKTFTEALFCTMPGISGILLTILLGAVAYTGRRQHRTDNFESFIYLHNVLVVAWPILLFFHGSQNWIGVGFPLVAFTSSLPIAAYVFDRALRSLRYYLYAGSHVEIVSATLREGEGREGLVYVQITPPPHLWTFHPGRYAFICMPEYSRFQWHPYTICSGDGDRTVDFLIAGVGDWSRELVRRVREARERSEPLPMVAIDGPYTSPSQGAMFQKVIIAVGAGIGITPFLSLMSSMISMIAEKKQASEIPLKEAHFFWMTRSVDEFLFGQGLFAKIVESPRLRHRIFLHLHTTAKEPGNDPQCYVFREALKKQSMVDREAFHQALSKMEEQGRVPHYSEWLTGPSLPWCWLSGGKQDVLWLSDLAESSPRRTKRPSKVMTIKDYGASLKPASWTASDYVASLAPSVMGSGRSKSLCVVQSTGAGDSQSGTGGDQQLLLPVSFGRPDFGMEVRSVGKGRPNYDVDIYVCGSDSIVKSLQDAAVVCNRHAKKDFEEYGGRRQRYTVHYERFG